MIKKDVLAPGRQAGCQGTKHYPDNISYQNFEFFTENRDLVDIYIINECNNECLFCMASECDLISPPFEQIKFELYRLKERGKDAVAFTGGECTLHPRIFELVSLAKRLGLRTIEMKSNGRNYKDISLIKKFIECGVNVFYISIHGPNKEIQDFITQKENSFLETTEGLANLDKFENIRARTYTVIVAQNYKYLPGMVSMLKAHKNVSSIGFGFPHPVHRGARNLHKFTVSYKEAAPYLLEALDVVASLKLHCIVENYPPCFLKGKENYLRTFFSGVYSNVFPYPPCIYKNGCIYGDLCGGIHSKYVELWGREQIEPVFIGDIIYKNHDVFLFNLSSRDIPIFAEGAELLKTSKGGIVSFDKDCFFVVLRPSGVELLENLKQKTTIYKLCQEKGDEAVRFILYLYQLGVIKFISVDNENNKELKGFVLDKTQITPVRYIYHYPFAIMPHYYPEYKFIED